VPGAGRLRHRSQASENQGTDRSRFVSMGFSLVGTPGAAPFLATVYVDRAESVARGAGIDPRRVLGLAIAHEIGHVLLNSNSHAPSGLMRADWSRTELRRQDPRHGASSKPKRRRFASRRSSGYEAVSCKPLQASSEPVQVLLLKPRPSDSQRPFVDFYRGNWSGHWSPVSNRSSTSCESGELPMKSSSRRPSRFVRVSAIFWLSCLAASTAFAQPVPRASQPTRSCG
jgi:hypothetical protein